MIPTVDTPHHTFTFGLWRGCSWSSCGLWSDEYLKFCLLTVRLSGNVLHQSLAEAGLDCKLTPCIDDISNELPCHVHWATAQSESGRAGSSSQSVRYAVHLSDIPKATECLHADLCDCVAQIPTFGLGSQVYEQNNNGQVVYFSQTLLHAIVLPPDKLYWEKELPTD